MKARTLLDTDGWRAGPDGIRAKRGRRLSLDFAAPSGQPDFQQIVELIRGTWQQIGVELNAQLSSPALLFASYENSGIIASGKFDVTIFAWGGPIDGDLTPLLACNRLPPTGQNDLHYCNPTVDKLLAEAQMQYDERKRKAILATIQRDVIMDGPLIVMGFGDNVYAYNSRVTGWHPNSTTPFDDMLGVDIESAR